LKIKNKIVVIATNWDWGKKVFENLKKLNKEFVFILIENEKSFINFLKKCNPDLIFLVGWSHIISKNIVKRNSIYGIHPSDLPNYAGGSPIQHQIIDGLVRSKITLFEIDSKIDNGKIISKKPISLEGNLDQVLEEISRKSLVLINNFIKMNPEINKIKISQNNKINNKKKVLLKRFKPEDGSIDKKTIPNLTTLELYNLIRCREFPYPNAYIEDKLGRLYFQKVDFKKFQKK
tara:strand:+ start:2796 stop:3494 length:699 start_codon:yes stop_codon:yes gene_type:complete